MNERNRVGPNIRWVLHLSEHGLSLHAAWLVGGDADVISGRAGNFC